MTSFTWELLGTFAGLIALIAFVVEMVKWLFKTSDAVTRYVAVAVGLVAGGAWPVLNGTYDVQIVVVAVINGALAALAAMKGYELVTSGFGANVSKE